MDDTFDGQWIELGGPNALSGRYHAAHRILHRKDGCVLSEFFDGSAWYWDLAGMDGRTIEHQPTPYRIPAPMSWANEQVEKGRV